MLSEDGHKSPCHEEQVVESGPSRQQQTNGSQNDDRGKSNDDTLVLNGTKPSKDTQDCDEDNTRHDEAHNDTNFTPNIEVEHFTDSIVQSVDVLALHGLDDDDTTQSSKSNMSIKEDMSFVFDDVEEEEDNSVYEDADDGSDDGNGPQQQVALHVYQSAKGLWDQGKEKFGVGAVLGMTESVCCTVAKAVGVSDIENDLVKPNLQFVDDGLQPTYAAISNAWNAAKYPATDPSPHYSKPVFQVEFPRSFDESSSDEDNWIPLNLSRLDSSLSRLDSLDNRAG